MEFEQALDQTIKELGFQSLKSKQREAVEAFIARKDVMVVLPTGCAKSIVYAMLPSLFDKIRGKFLLYVYY